jgi:hypothetical protein
MVEKLAAKNWRWNHLNWSIQRVVKKIKDFINVKKRPSVVYFTNL